MTITYVVGFVAAVGCLGAIPSGFLALLPDQSRPGDWWPSPKEFRVCFAVCVVLGIVAGVALLYLEQGWKP